MRTDAICEAITSIRYARLFAEYGLLNQLLSNGYETTNDDFSFAFHEMIGFTMDFVCGDYLEDYELEKWYFSDQSIMEYYRLCRLYSRAHRQKLKDNPYMRQAEDFVDAAMDLGSAYGYGWTLQTKIGHQWASGILFQQDCYFTQDMALLRALLEIRAWYRQAVYCLRGQLLEERILRFPALPAHEECAA